MGVQNMSHHQNLSKPITTSSIGKWKKELSQEQISLIQSLIEENLNRFKLLLIIKHFLKLSLHH